MEPKINESDFVIARKTDDADSGSIVVCVNDGEALIKKIKKERRNVILISLNPKYQPFLAARNFKIEGEVRGVITNKVF
jgi:SOS-response transcriptional repressor LexA